MKVTIWYLASDRHEDGTQCELFGSEALLNARLTELALEDVPDKNRAEFERLLEENFDEAMDAWDDCRPFSDTYDYGYEEVEVPDPPPKLTRREEDRLNDIECTNCEKCGDGIYTTDSETSKIVSAALDRCDYLCCDCTSKLFDFLGHNPDEDDPEMVSDEDYVKFKAWLKLGN